MAILDLLFPKNCLGCSRGGSYVCSGCLGKVRRAKQVCVYCGRLSIDGFTHSKCKKKYGLDGAISLWKYEGVVRQAIVAVKYKYALEIAKEIVAISQANQDHMVLDIKNITSVPVYWYKENVRGFNQSEILGHLLAESMNWNFIPDLVVKIRPTKPQVELKGKERRRNLKGGVFEVNVSYKDLPKNIFIFDDVATTGSTLHEVAKVLKMSGVEQVWGLTIAR